MKVLYLFRGIAGAGKTTCATKMVGAENVYAADDYFYHGSEYCFDKNKLGAAHNDCRRRVELAMKNGKPEIAVANTFVKQADMTIYKTYAKLYGYKVVELTIKSDFKNVHDVPKDVLQRMQETFEY